MDFDTTIADRAFQGCHRLKTVYIGAQVMSIGTEAFYNCVALETVVFVGRDDDSISSLAIINKYAFANTALLGIDLPPKLVTIGASAFEGSRQLRIVTFEAGCSNTVTIGEYAFVNTALLSIELPPSATCNPCTPDIVAICVPSSQPTGVPSSRPTAPTSMPTSVPTVKVTTSAGLNSLGNHISNNGAVYGGVFGGLTFLAAVAYYGFYKPGRDKAALDAATGTPYVGNNGGSADLEDPVEHVHEHEHGHKMEDLSEGGGTVNPMQDRPVQEKSPWE